ncbi:MAG: polymer-forming cytoskeletal protein [Nitrosomonadaceae bacterium]
MSERINSIIGVGTYIVGNISFTGSMRIDGHVCGDVTEAGKKPSTLILSDHARVEGRIKVSNAVINGAIVSATNIGGRSHKEPYCPPI